MTRSPNIIQIDPHRALCWGRGSSVRIGFDRVLAEVKAPSPAAQRLLGALIAGIPAEELDEPTLTRRHGKAGHDLIGQLRPALVSRAKVPNATSISTTPSAIRARLHDDGREVPGLRFALESQWLCQFERGHAPPEFVVQVLRFLEPLERTRRWLSEGIPHLLIRFTDDSVRVGPLVSGVGSPCHSCEVLGLLDEDPALPAFAAQLYGTVPCTESAVVAGLAGAIAAVFVEAWKSGDTWVHDLQVKVPISRGQVSGIPLLTRIRPHPECGCSLSEEFQPRQ